LASGVRPMAISMSRLMRSFEEVTYFAGAVLEWIGSVSLIAGKSDTGVLTAHAVASRAAKQSAVIVTTNTAPCDRLAMSASILVLEEPVTVSTTNRSTELRNWRTQ
jgi:hypothetical protein